MQGQSDMAVRCPDAGVRPTLPHMLVEKRGATLLFQQMYLRNYGFFGLILSEFLF